MGTRGGETQNTERQSLTLLPPPERCVLLPPRVDALEALRDTETGQEASRAALVLGAMAGQGTREAMADRGAWVAKVDPGTQEAMAERGAWEASMGGSPPKNFYWGDSSSPGGSLEAWSLGALGSRTEPAGALESRTEPAGALESRTEPAGALESWTGPARAPETERSAWAPGTERSAWAPGTERSAWAPGKERNAWAPRTERNPWAII